MFEELKKTISEKLYYPVVNGIEPQMVLDDVLQVIDSCEPQPQDQPTEPGWWWYLEKTENGEPSKRPIQCTHVWKWQNYLYCEIDHTSFNCTSLHGKWYKAIVPKGD